MREGLMDVDDLNMYHAGGYYQGWVLVRIAQRRLVVSPMREESTTWYVVSTAAGAPTCKRRHIFFRNDSDLDQDLIRDLYALKPFSRKLASVELLFQTSEFFIGPRSHL
jgi:hypothetical protein